MKKSILVVSFFLICILMYSQKNKMPAKAESLYNSEKEFSAYCMAHGLKESFLKYFDDKAITFSPHAVNATGFYYLEPENAGRLSWKPSIVEISNDGKLGFTMGPVEYQASYNPGDTVHYSHYFSVWQKKDGIWKVVLDKGIHYKNKMPDIEVKYLTHSDSKTNKLSFTNIVNKDYSGTMKTSRNIFKNSTIFGREGIWPFTAKDSLPKDLEQIKTWKVLDGQMASSADLAYMYGIYELTNERKEKGYFLRVWVYKDSDWFVRVDIHFPYKK